MEKRNVNSQYKCPVTQNRNRVSVYDIKTIPFTKMFLSLKATSDVNWDSYLHLTPGLFVTDLFVSSLTSLNKWIGKRRAKNSNFFKNHLL